ncbi:hypothetical protein KXD40_001297 [Peronospora effusa]|uniref:Uncharacterized protein n=1 Tax=Peronospora effusa TaxID=542832 RepID=A0A3M6VLR0_9STRA|nr:hypothetical protein DD238_000312 [Peronospora effusa]RQM18111.1 hypothetical protein DD237_000429 [Peronospora effusa]UIZ20826.1 hypothetical protein KXD40_001297 [Peronospora effusa]
MTDGKRKTLSSSFLCSPIPKDPSQIFFVEESSSLQVCVMLKKQSQLLDNSFNTSDNLLSL